MPMRRFASYPDSLNLLFDRLEGWDLPLREGQGQAGTWVWIGVADVSALCDEYRISGARIRGKLRNYPGHMKCWSRTPDGHILRFGSEPRTDIHFTEEPVQL